MSDVRIVKLGDICDISMGQAPPGDSYNQEEVGMPLIAGAGDFKNGVIIPSKYTKKPTKICSAGDIILSIRASIGPKVLADKEYCLGRGVAGIRVNSNVNLRYLWHWLTYITPQLISRARGATFVQISRKDISDIQLALPHYDEQTRISRILDNLTLIQKGRERQLAALDELASALFVKYFGHPSLSPKYKTVSIGDICKVVTGNSPSKKDINNYGNVIEWVKSNNLGGLHPSKAKEYLSEQGKNKGRVASPGSILVTCIAGSHNSIGKCSLVDREIAFNQQINAIYPSNNILADFLYYQIKTFPYLVQEKTSGGMKGIVNKSKFESIRIILPPKEVQEEFSETTQRIRIHKEYIQKSSDLSKTLFSSLQFTLFDH